MKQKKSNLINFTIGSAKSSKLVERSTVFHSTTIDSHSEPTDIDLYKLASQYAELKTLMGYKDVTTKTEYKFLSEEAYG